MKRYIALILTTILLLTGCSKKSEYNEQLKAENSEIKETEMYLMNNTIYGKSTGTDKTYTGLEPLPLNDFSDANIAPNGYNTEKISHSFGVAENESPNQISVNSQNFFDDNDFNALTVDVNNKDKVVYLTFDVGYDNGFTDIILDTLKDKNVTAAFFCTVDEMKSNPQAIARMINEGHIVGNHTLSHPSMDELSREEMVKEIKGFDDYLRTNFGYSSPYFRFPKGEYSEEALDLAGDMGYMSVFWSLAYADWDVNNQKGATYAHDTVVSRIHPGAVILLHAVSEDNAKALGQIIDSVKNMGYTFQSLENYRNNN